jgi:hypothetical protein
VTQVSDHRVDATQHFDQSFSALRRHPNADIVPPANCVTAEEHLGNGG